MFADKLCYVSGAFRCLLFVESSTVLNDTGEIESHTNCSLQRFTAEWTRNPAIS